MVRAFYSRLKRFHSRPFKVTTLGKLFIHVSITKQYR